MTKKNTTNQEPQIEVLEEGTPVKIGKKTFIVPPLPITVLHKSGFYKLEKELQDAQKKGDVEAIGENTLKLLEFAYKAILINYPEATREETVDLVTTGVLKKLVPALVDTPEGLEQAKNG